MDTRIVTYAAAALMVGGLLQAPHAANAKSFKAKYYKECYAGVKEVAPLVTPKESLQKKAGKLGGLFGSVSSLAGLGGAGGSMVKAANTVNQINKYSGIIDDVAGFSAQMRTDHPNPNDRFAAYGDQMSSEAHDLSDVTVAVTASQQCYGNELTTLKAEVASGELKKSKAKKHLKEIQAGVRASGDVLLLAINRLNTNLSSYDEALAGEKTYMAEGVHAMAGQGLLQNAALKTGSPAVAYVGMSHLSTLSGLASFASTKADTGSGIATDNTSYAGLESLAASSQKYLELNEQVRETAEKQRLLELEANKGLD
ncbi:hypothetical protein [Kordiimonas aestuarii]|uniref:hypothetical protein n=1 Tax=Kordiimonas aestuarii TaxID=1005925 RepID=UPI0021CE3249|nr:hypothetical protein [Kordiimonas aestuarii]